MAIDFQEKLLNLVYSELNGAISGVGIYSFVPGQDEGEPDEDFPYIVIGLDGGRPFDTDSHLGKVFDIYLHIWSRYKGAKEVREIMDQIYARLHRAQLSASGVNIIDSLEVFSQVYLEPDGKTMHGIVRYRTTVTEE